MRYKWANTSALVKEVDRRRLPHNITDDVSDNEIRFRAIAILGTSDRARETIENKIRLTQENRITPKEKP